MKLDCKISYVILVILILIPSSILLLYALKEESSEEKKMKAAYAELIESGNALISQEAKDVFENHINYLDKITQYPIWRTSFVVALIIGLFTFSMIVIVKDAFVVGVLTAITSVLFIILRTNFYTFHTVQNSTWT